MKIVFFDIETGGLNWWPHVLNGKAIPMNPIIQIAAIAVETEDWRELGTFERKILFRPECAAPEALEINSYEETTWRETAIRPEQAVRDFAQFLEPFKEIEKVSQRTGRGYRVAMLGGHNVGRFDAPFLSAWFGAFNQFLPADWHTFDTMSLALAHSMLTGTRFKDFKLATLCEALGIEPGTHDALADVRATVGLARVLMNSIKTTEAQS